MAKQTINIGSSANSRNGDPLRTAFDKVNQNFSELYNMGVGGGASVTVGGTPPETPTEGSLWWNSEDGKLYIDYNGSWIDTSSPAGSVTIDRLTAGDAEFVLGNNGVSYVTFPASNGNQLAVQGTEIGTLSGALTLTSRDGSVLLSAHADRSPRLFWEFDRNGTLTVPHLLPVSFTAVLNNNHSTAPITLDGTPWQFNVQFQVNSNGTVETILDQIFPILTNPGYADGNEFVFTEADHGIPNYELTIALTDVILPGGAGWTANPACSVTATYPPTINSEGAIKVTSNGNSWVFGSDGVMTLPIGGDIVDSNGSSVLGGGESPSTGNFTFDGNTLYATPVDTIIGTDFNTNPPGHTVTFQHNGGVNGGSGGELKFDYGSAKIKVVQDAGTTYTWTFGSSGITTIPGFIQHVSTLNYLHLNDVDSEISLVSEGNNAVNIKVDTNNNNLSWKFGTTGNMTLPGGGSITITGGGVDITAPGGSGGYAELLSNNQNNAVWVDNAGAYVATAGANQWTFTTDGYIRSPGTTTAGIESASTIQKFKFQNGGPRIVSDNNHVWVFGDNGDLTFPDTTIQSTAYQTTSPPGSSKGRSSDRAGMVSFDNSNFYYCKQNYSDGQDDIWVKTAWTSTSW